MEDDEDNFIKCKKKYHIEDDHSTVLQRNTLDDLRKINYPETVGKEAMQQLIHKA